MPIKPPSQTYTCPSCGWKKTVSPKSDALMPGVYFDTCPTCGCENLTERKSTVFEQVSNNVLGKISR